MDDDLEGRLWQQQQAFEEASKRAEALRDKVCTITKEPTCSDSGSSMRCCASALQLDSGVVACFRIIKWYRVQIWPNRM